ncbi:hypothetical protein E3O06_11935 [Cryobacterium glaciale]|uniref:Serine/arginine repetitive matrix protein 2 n=1 Tax=Cryobacterium glaciale TaxID=1259145 RepID=A0A4R8UWE7_9MICO|nr:hypothetical protein [Cryobacterium glaciale]TFB71548.1 hypothetical protein E3O06_11935 [Cryobacterium glaciale]
MDWQTQRDKESKSFRESEGLRILLARLQANGGVTWRTDPEASELMRFAARRYAGLARKHGLDPWEAAAAAYDAMRASSTLRADDPWAMVTRAVQVTCIAEERAQGLLCSVHQARRPKVSAFHDAERFSDREHALTDYHPAFRTSPADAQPDEPPRVEVAAAVEDAIMMFTLLDWPADRARNGVEYVCGRLADAPSRASAYESLRRDYPARALLDVPQRAWMAMLRALLGSGNPLQAHTKAGHGILLRLLLGEPLRALFHDDDLVADIVNNAPGARV